ncbi:GntR family transcriptional regulator [Occultella gossypii]|uniref:GntR family transcriptional regulator n=1 Tax=Occultella gossypii TaxID=2800820 RepID=A0ABS7S5C1_9MICO|nr:GntR family transcriptional regulator [Occultella gossypii]MBZ2195544.1 GntR family transcriptional regulator [Occultella gossypii]
MTPGDSTVTFGPAQRRVLADDVTDQLRAAIVSGSLPPGERLREDELATQMSVSRGPIREAFVKLEREGLIVIERYKGARVVELYRDDIDQIFSLRTVLEALGAEWACQHATEADIEELGRVLDRFLEATPDTLTPELIAELDIAFHDGIMQASRHDRLIRAWDGLKAQISSFLITRLALRKDYGESWEPDHRELLGHIANKRVDEAVAHIRGHVNASYQRVVDAMENRD